MLEFKPEDEIAFLHKEITEAIIGSASEVYNHLGYGFLHRVYQRSLQVELMRRGFSGDLEKRTTVRYKDVIVGEYDGDMNCSTDYFSRCWKRFYYPPAIAPMI